MQDEAKHVNILPYLLTYIENTVNCAKAQNNNILMGHSAYHFSLLTPVSSHLLHISYDIHFVQYEKIITAQALSNISRHKIY